MLSAIARMASIPCKVTPKAWSLGGFTCARGDSAGQQTSARHPRKHATQLAAVLTATILSMGCQQEMARQPSFRPLRESSFFDDARSARPLVAGTVPRGSEIVSGRRSMQAADWTRIAGLTSLLPETP